MKTACFLGNAFRSGETTGDVIIDVTTVRDSVFEQNFPVVPKSVEADKIFVADSDDALAVDDGLIWIDGATTEGGDRGEDFERGARWIGAADCLVNESASLEHAIPCL